MKDNTIFMHKSNADYLRGVLEKCNEFNIEEIKQVFYSDYPVLFLEAFIDAIKKEVNKIEQGEQNA